MKIFSVYDARANYYLQPFFSRTAQTAAREFGIAVRDEGTMFNRHPADFTLVEIGDFDEEIGRVDGVQHVVVASAEALMEVTDHE